MFSVRYKNSIILILIWICLWCNAEENSCLRTCQDNESPMDCVYNFTLEYYTTLSKACYSCPDVIEDCEREDCVPGDGRKRSIMTVNRQLPGPSIEVCLGDTIIVNVLNNLLSDTTTLHWHGQHQESTPYMDGTPYVTQCPILPGQTFTYKFTATQIGTHFWHSHSGLQRGEGIFGPLVIRGPEEQDPHKHLYDYDLSEHVIAITDWTEANGLEDFLMFYHSDGNNRPSNILINGKGPYEGLSSDDNSSYTPIERFHVEQGFRYRFRVIYSGNLNCPIEISVEDHPITIISTDGNDIEATDAGSLVIYAGERFDFIIDANQTEGLYWMKFRGLVNCADNSGGIYQVALLQYSKDHDGDLPQTQISYWGALTEGVQINPLNVGMEETNASLSMAHLSSAEEDDDERLTETPDYKYVIPYKMNSVDNPLYHKHNVYGVNNVTNPRATPQLNHVTMKFLPFPLLSERSHLNEGTFCNETTISEECEKEFCACTHVIQVPLGSVVEIILVAEDVVNHPFHLHGTTFRVVGMEAFPGGTSGEKIKALDASGSLKRNLVNPPLKDTVTVPAPGYTIIRFIASNPGFWLMHCHLEHHTAVGMALVFQFGDHHDMLPVPKNFPRCGNYNPLHV